MRTYIIAEAGVNHNGSLALAKQLVDAAKASGADCVKFQTFNAQNVVSKHAEKAAYQKRETGSDESQYDMIKKLELSFDEFAELHDYCNQSGIEFLSTPFDRESIVFLSSLGMKRWKIPSGEITNLPHLIQIARQGEPVILSTGMSTMEEVGRAVTLLKDNGSGEITLLHCTTEYPAPFADANLRAMQTMRDKFDLPVGYSDHTEGIEASIAAVALGADIIEKHFTLDKSMEGPDHRASLEPQELKTMVQAIRNIELAIGSGTKKVADSERKNMIIARKSIVAKRDIKQGETLSEENLTVKRPGSGISPMMWFDVLGQTAKRDFKEDEMIEL